MAWTQPGDEIITWGGAHIVQLEQGALAILSGLVTRMVESQSGVMTVEEGLSGFKHSRAADQEGQEERHDWQDQLNRGREQPL